MKLLRKLIYLISIFSFVLCNFSCCLTYDCTQVNNIIFGYSKIEKSAFIGGITYHEGEEKNIILPEKYNSITIKDLGGYFGRGVPTPFGIQIIISPDYPYEEIYNTLEEYIYDSDLKWWDDYEVNNYFFTITLPSKLKNITYTSCKDILVITSKKEDNTIFASIYRPVYYFIIDEDNPNFYTKEGKLYNKSTNQLYEEFLYE